MLEYTDTQFLKQIYTARGKEIRHAIFSYVIFFFFLYVKLERIRGLNRRYTPGQRDRTLYISHVMFCKLDYRSVSLDVDYTCGMLSVISQKSAISQKYKIENVNTAQHSRQAGSNESEYLRSSVVRELSKVNIRAKYSAS